MHNEQSDTHAMTTEELRKFGWVTGLMIILFIGVLLPWLADKNILDWQKITFPIGSVLIAWAFAHPASLTHIYKPWMYLAEKIGWVNTRIIMAILFYVIIMPIGIIMRVFGHDPMARQFQSQAQSYRITKEPQPKDHMETPY
jgi:hypothetical protein